MSQEFTLVRNKRTNRGPIKKPPIRPPSGSFAYLSCTPHQPKARVEDFMSVFNNVRSKIETCDYYKDLCSKASEYLDNTTDIICYGIGSIQTNKQSLHQFALITLLRKHLKISGELYIFDPVLTDEDTKFARHSGCTIIDTNEEGKRKVSKKTIFFMPHCTKPLYSNVLWANWSLDNLQLISIIGNSFIHYNQRMIQRATKYDYVERISGYTTEISLIGSAPMEEAFNDINLHIFQEEKLQESKGERRGGKEGKGGKEEGKGGKKEEKGGKENRLWRDHAEPPPFAETDDPELIGVQQNTS